MTDSKAAVSNPQDDPSLSQPADAADRCGEIDMEQYRAAVPLWKRVYQHSLTQMILLSVQAFCGPAMSDAITGEIDIPSCVIV